MSRHLCFYNNDTLLSDNTEPGYFSEFNVPADTNLIVCYDDDYKITGNIRVTASSNQDMIYYQFATDSAIFLLKSLQNYTQNQTVRAQITVSNIAKDSNNLVQDIQNYLQNCGVSSGSSIDFSTIVTALNSITTALSALSNLSNLSNLVDLANIITAINNKDNQSNIVNELRYIFTQSVSTNSYRSVDGKTNLSVFKSSHNSSNFASVENLSRVNLRSAIANISNKLSSVNDSYADSQSTEVQNKFLYTLSKTTRALFSNESSIQNVSLSDIVSSSFLKSISDKLNNIETKLEQNLPFTVVVDNEIVETNVSQNCNYSTKIEQIPFSE